MTDTVVDANGRNRHSQDVVAMMGTVVARRRGVLARNVSNGNQMERL
jgi:hypothetical protein